MKKYILCTTINQEDKSFYTPILVDHCNNEPAKLYANIYGDTKRESTDRAIAIINILKVADQL